MTFKEKLVRLRKIKGLTQDEFASAVGVSRQAVYKWESGQSYPEVAKLLEIKILFNISIDDLLDENYVVELPEKKKKKRAPKAQKVEEAPAKEEAVISEEKAEEIREAAVEVEEAPAPVSIPEATEEPVAEAPAAESAPAKIEEPAAEPAPAEDTSKKKVGFFGRIFGRK